MDIKIKVCGMRDINNIKMLGELSFDFMGLIFYPKSPRYVDHMDPDDIRSMHMSLRQGKERVGVFVNAELNQIYQKTLDYGLDLIQLHGNESPAFCEELNKTMPIIKAFNISQPSDFDQTKDYEGLWGYFLFDTKTPQLGGSGKKFDWSILKKYTGSVPFFLSGGISADDVVEIKKINHLQLYGVDINSRFETEPGVKDVELIKQFIKSLKDE